MLLNFVITKYIQHVYLRRWNGLVGFIIILRAIAGRMADMWFKSGLILRRNPLVSYHEYIHGEAHDTCRRTHNGRQFFYCTFMSENSIFIFISRNSVLTNNKPAVGSDNDLGINRQQVIIWSNDGQIYWRAHASLYLEWLMELQMTWLWTKFLLNCYVKYGAA